MRSRSKILATILLCGLLGLPVRAHSQNRTNQDQTNQDQTNQELAPTPVPDAPQSMNSPQRENPREQNARVFETNPASAEHSWRPNFSAHARDFLQDEKQIWTAPTRIRFSDATWLVPLGGVAAGLFATDHAYSASLSQNPMTIHHYKAASDLAIGSLIGAGAGLYLFSFPAHNEHWRETGFLAGEAALNALATTEALKYSFRRARPYQDNGSGSFFKGGVSFPSERSAVAWSIAGVIGHEYSGPLPKLFAYGMASAVSFAQVRSRQHFPSDAFIGSTLGYLIAQTVYSRRHDPEAGGAAWQSMHELVNDDRVQSTSFKGSPYVPLDSWIYPAMERLAAMGYVKSDSLGIRPWTRLECARLLSEAAELSPETDGPPEVQELARSLSEEFASESAIISGNDNSHAQLESVYQRSLAISGKPLADGYHFGQTIQNDYGRPFQEGFNTVAGTSAWATAGPFVFYARGEYERAPAGPAPSQAVLSFISTADYLPANAPSVPIAATSRLRPLDLYVGMNLANWQITFGRQSLWWGPSDDGAILFTNNAQPLNNMFRVNRVSPFRLPWVLGYLGDIRLDFFLGRLAGQEFINNGNLGAVAQGTYGVNLNPQPFLSGFKISFKFTQNFEFSMAKTTIYGGPGNPLTLKTLFESTASLHENGEPLGDGRSVADFSYRIPKLRNWLTFYGEGFSEDEVSPLNTPEKSVWQGGLYAPRLPRIPHLDLRVEGGFTSPVDFASCNGCFYHNFQYVNGYTNDGQLIGSWIGRAAQGEALTSNYWLSANKRIGFELKHRKIDTQFLPQGGTQNDVAVNSDFLLKSGFRLSGTLQYERWQIPLIATGPQSNVTALLQFSYWPKVGTRQ